MSFVVCFVFWLGFGGFFCCLLFCLLLLFVSVGGVGWGCCGDVLICGYSVWDFVVVFVGGFLMFVE